MTLSKIFVNNQDTGFDGIPLQETGTSTVQAMSQKAVTDELNKLYLGTVIDMKSLPYQGYVRQSDQGITIDSSNWVHSNFIECRPGSRIIGLFRSHQSVCSIGFFDSDLQLTGTVCDASADFARPFLVDTIVPTGTKYLRLTSANYPEQDSYCILPSVVPSLLGSVDNIDAHIENINGILGETLRRGSDSTTATRDLNVLFNCGSRWIQNTVHNHIILDISTIPAATLSILELSIETFETRQFSKLQFNVFNYPGSYVISCHAIQDENILGVWYDTTSDHIVIQMTSCSHRLVSVNRVVYTGTENPNLRVAVDFANSKPDGNYIDVEIQNYITDIRQNVNILDKNLNKIMNITSSDFTLNGFIDNEGNLHNDSNWKHTAEIECEYNSYINYSLYTHQLVSIITCLNENKEIIHLEVFSTHSLRNGIFISPLNTKYIVLSTNAASVSSEEAGAIIKTYRGDDNKVDKNIYYDLTSLMNIYGFVEEDGITISGYDANWIHSDFLDMEPGKLVTYSMTGHKNVCSIAFFDEQRELLSKVMYEGSKTGAVVISGNVTSPANTAYIRICAASSGIGTDSVGYYVEVVKTIEKLLNDSEKEQEKTELSFVFPYAIYDVCNDVPNNHTNGGRNRNMSAALYLDHMLVGLTEEIDAHFKDANDSLQVHSLIKVTNANESNPSTDFNHGSNIYEETINASVIGDNILTQEFSVKHRSTLNSITSSAKPLVLCIGDSITYAEQATMPNDGYAVNHAYHLICKQLFMKDKIDNGNSGFDIIFLGHYTKENSFKYNDTEYNVKTCHEGIRGISMAAHISGQVPEFSDGDGHWSLAAWLSKYRTMDDTGNRLPWYDAGATVTGQDGKQYTIGTLVTSEQMLNNIDVCLPTHVLIMLSMNGGANISQYNTMISAIRTIAPNCIIGIAIPDCEGTYFPSKHPTYGEEATYWVNKQGWGAEAKHNQQRNVQMNVTNEYANAESESDGVYVLPFFFVTPPAESICNRLLPLPDSDVNRASKLMFDAYGWGPQVHTNAYGHMHWGYQLYSWIKYTIAKAL